MYSATNVTISPELGVKSSGCSVMGLSYGSSLKQLNVLHILSTIRAEITQPNRLATNQVQHGVGRKYRIAEAKVVKDVHCVAVEGLPTNSACCQCLSPSAMLHLFFFEIKQCFIWARNESYGQNESEVLVYIERGLGSIWAR